MSPLARVRVDSIAAGGDGVGRADGLAVFIPRTAPGDVADVRLTPRGRYARGALERLVQPAGQRVTPRCQHYVADRCGGCQLQHLSYEAQLDAKRHIVQDALVRIGHRAVELPAITPSALQWEYRARLTLTMRRESGVWTFGLHRFDAPDRIFALEECPITDRAIVLAWREVHAASTYLPDAHELRGTVRRTGEDLAFQLEGASRWDAAREFAARCSSLHVVRWTPDGQASRMLVDRRRGVSPATAFEQVNPSVADVMRSTLTERILALRPATVIDAYAGSGAVARTLAEAGVRVTAIELDPEATAFASARAPEGMTVLTARVEDVMAQVLPADVVVLNPPRAGVDRRVTDALQRAPRPRALLYVSCDPATLARDVARLPGYRLAHVAAFDMFPQTAHVEVLCELLPTDG